MPDMVYADTTNDENASLQITPTWFDSGSVQGTGTIQIRVILPEGIQPDEVLYQDVEFSDKGTENGRTVAIWAFEDVAATKAYRVGVSFPRRVMTNVIEVTTLDLFFRWLGAALGGIGAIVGVCFPIALPLFIVWIVIRAIKKAGKPNYLPPIAQVEGGGIKRGLTAPEAAVILELPLNKILALVIFGMLEKGLIRQVDDDPLKVEVVEDFRVADKPHLDTPKARRRYRTDVAQRLGTVVHKYEDGFLDVIEASPDKAVKDLKVVTAMDGLVKGASAKMQGFDLSDTQDYYKRVIERAMEQAAALGEIEQREQYLDKYMPWVMMDKGYGTVLTVGQVQLLAALGARQPPRGRCGKWRSRADRWQERWRSPRADIRRCKCLLRRVGRDDDGRDGGCDYAHVAAETDAGEYIVIVSERQFPQ